MQGGTSALTLSPLRLCNYAISIIPWCRVHFLWAALPRFVSVCIVESIHNAAVLLLWEAWHRHCCCYCREGGTSLMCLYIAAQGLFPPHKEDRQHPAHTNIASCYSTLTRAIHSWLSPAYQQQGGHKKCHRVWKHTACLLQQTTTKQAGQASWQAGRLAGPGWLQSTYSMCLCAAGAYYQAHCPYNMACKHQHKPPQCLCRGPLAR